MKLSSSLCVIFSVIALIAAAPAKHTDALTPSGYIIKLKRNVPSKSVASFVKTYNSANLSIESVNTNRVKHVYDSAAFHGLAGSFSPAFLADLKKKYGDNIEYIEKDGEKHIVGTQSDADWGLARVGARVYDGSDNTYDYPDAAGSGINVFIVDTGLQPNITDYEGRATMDASFVDGEDAIDLNGHGSHCAGTIGGALYGVAKKVSLHGVKVLDGQGSGSDSSVIAGIDYVAKNAVKGKTVINMSLGGSKSQALDDAVAAAAQAGVVVIVAAGNESQDACTESPSGSPDAFAVGAVDNTNAMTSFSNFGKCVRLFAPGQDITSVWIGETGTETNTISGTSMASPHVAGVAAVLMSQKGYSDPKDVYADLVNYATKNVLSGITDDDSNLVAYNKMEVDSNGSQ